MTLQELRTTKRDEILLIAAKRGARNVRVFGSVARGDDDEQSDIDFLVDLEPDRSLFDLSGLLIDLEAALHSKGRRNNRITLEQSYSSRLAGSNVVGCKGGGRALDRVRCRLGTAFDRGRLRLRARFGCMCCG